MQGLTQLVRTYLDPPAVAPPPADAAAAAMPGTPCTPAPDSLDAAPTPAAPGPSIFLAGLHKPVVAALRNSASWVAVSLAPAFNPTQPQYQRPATFKFVDDTQYRPMPSHAAASAEAARVAGRLEAFTQWVRQDPLILLDEAPAFPYRVYPPGALRPLWETAPALNLLEYALMERNPPIAGIMAGELTSLARSGSMSAWSMLQRAARVAVAQEDAAFTSMMLMALAGSQPAGWLQAQAAAANQSLNPVATTLESLRAFVRQQLNLDSATLAAHWIYQDPCVRDMIATCTRDILLFAAGARLQARCHTAPLHPNHFMHGTLVLGDLQQRLAAAASHENAALLQQLQEMVRILRQPERVASLEAQLRQLQSLCDSTPMNLWPASS